MSDEVHLESAFRRVDPTRRVQWHALAPDEAAVLAEEGPGELSRRAELLEALMAFLFADGAEDWRAVAGRAARALKEFAPGVAAGMSGGLGRRFNGFGLEELRELVGEDGEIVGRLLGWLFQERGASGLRSGCQRTYLVAKAFQGFLLERAGGEAGEMGFEEFARAFGEMGSRSGGKAGARARSRWSARAEKMIRRPLEAGCGAAGKADLFGKMAATRAKYQAAAMGNENRRKRE